MKEDPRKEDQTNGQSLYVSGDTGWAHCPICKDLWRTWHFRYPMYAVWEHSGFPPNGDPNVHVPEQLCPIHAKEIIVNGRAKGPRTILNQDQLKEMSEYGLHCPACDKGALESTDSGTNSWTCRRCRASILTEQVITSDGKVEVKYCSFRRDLGKRKPEKLPWRKVEFLDRGAIALKKM